VLLSPELFQDLLLDLLLLTSGGWPSRPSVLCSEGRRGLLFPELFPDLFLDLLPLLSGGLTGRLLRSPRPGPVLLFLEPFPDLFPDLLPLPSGGLPRRLSVLSSAGRRGLLSPEPSLD